MRRVPRHVVRRAEPRQLLAEADVRRDDVGARRRWKQEARRRLQLIVPLQAGAERRAERAGRRRDARVADLRIDARGRQIDVALERHLHRIVDGHAKRLGDGRCWGLCRQDGGRGRRQEQGQGRCAHD